MLHVSSSLRRQLDTVTKDEDLKMEGNETIPVVLIVLRGMLSLHVPLIIINNTIVLVTFYYCQSLRTPDNHILAGLAVADILCGITDIPILLINNFDNAYFLRTKELCFLVHSILVFTAGFNLNIFTLLTIDRFLAINRPFWYMKHIHNDTVVKAMVGCFVFQSLYISSMAVTFRYDNNEKDLFTRCAYTNNFPLWISTHLKLTILSSQLIICLFCTSNVVVTLRKKLRELKIISREEYVKKLASAKITITLMFIYFCLYSPSLLLLIIRDVSYSTRVIMYVIVDHLRYTNCWVNAIIYAFSRKAYKEAYKHILTHWPNEWSIVVHKLRLASQNVESTPTSRKVSKIADTTIEEKFSSQDTESGEKNILYISNKRSLSNEKIFLSQMNTEATVTEDEFNTDEKIYVCENSGN